MEMLGIDKKFARAFDLILIPGHTNLEQVIQLKKIEDIILVKTIAQILVRFTSDQVVTTTNKAGEIIDNTNLITNRMIDRWTFEKDLKEAGPIWLLVKTESLA